MTDETARVLGLRAVAFEGWRWLPGMLAVRTEGPNPISEGADPKPFIGRAYRVESVGGEGGLVVKCFGEAFRVGHPHFVPDLRDPCTLGGLLALVREAWGGEHLSVVYNSDEYAGTKVYAGWCLWFDYDGPWGGVHGYYTTEAEALVAALEAAP